MSRFRKMLLAAAPLVAGTVYSCAPVPALFNLADGFNPCLTILLCNPAEYQFATSGLEGAGADPNKSPFCTFPPYCTADQDPLFGGLR